MINVLFISPPKSQKFYQGLSNEFSSIEPPTWALILAKSCRSKNFTVDILDVSAENLSIEAIKNNVLLPSSYEGYSFHSYESHPLSNEFLDSATILDFRDKAFIEYHSNEVFKKNKT